MNNYLDSIVNELKDFPQSNSEILNLIQSRKNVYNRFKREFIKNINTIENEDLIAFALLIAAKNTDFELHQILSEHFDFNEDGVLRYSNNSKYKNDVMIRKEGLLFVEGVIV